MSKSELTSREQQWVARLEDVLLDCPERLELMTIGDARLTVIDRAGARASELSDGAAERDGIVLAHVRSGCLIHGVSG